MDTYLDKLEWVLLPSEIKEHAIVPVLEGLKITLEEIQEVEMEPFILYYKDADGVFWMSVNKFSPLNDGSGTMATLIRRDHKTYDEALEAIERRVHEGHERLYSKIIVNRARPTEEHFYVLAGVGVPK